MMNRQPGFPPAGVLLLVPDGNGPVSRGRDQSVGTRRDGQAGHIGVQVQDRSQRRAGRQFPGCWPHQRKDDEHQDQDEEKRRRQRDLGPPEQRRATAILFPGKSRRNRTRRAWLAPSVSKREVAAALRSLQSTARMGSRKRSRLPESDSCGEGSRELRAALEEPLDLIGVNEAAAGIESCSANQESSSSGSTRFSGPSSGPRPVRSAIRRLHLVQGHGLQYRTDRRNAERIQRHRMVGRCQSCNRDGP